MGHRDQGEGKSLARRLRLFKARRERDRSKAGAAADGFAGKGGRLRVDRALRRAMGSAAAKLSIIERRSARSTYAATRRFCLTRVEVERFAPGLLPFRFGLRDWFRFRLS